MPIADTHRLIGMLETALQALLSSQQHQAALLAQLQAGQVGLAQLAPAPQPAATPTPAPAALSPQASDRTLSAWLDIHWAAIQRQGLKPQTLRNRKALVDHIRRLWGSVPVAELRPHQVSAALQEFAPDRLHTGRRVLGELRAVLLDAVANDWATTNAAATVKIATPKVKRKRLTLDTWVAMWAHSQTSNQTWLQCLLLLAVLTGQRRADLAKMSFEDIFTDQTGAKFLRVEQQKQAGKGYGARVEIPLAIRLEALDVSLEQVIDLCRECGKPGPTLLRKSNGKPLELSSLSARFHECVQAVCPTDAYGPDEWPSLHEARSLSARLYDAEGHDVQTLLGHSAQEMTDLYLDDRGLSAKEWKRVGLRAPLTATLAAVAVP